MSNPAEHPPQSCGKVSATVVVGDNVIVGFEPAFAQPGHKSMWSREWMPAVMAGFFTGQVVIQISMQGSGYMAFFISRPA
jgi:hypothetical protein